MTPNLSYWSVRANNWTFTNTKIRAWVESKLHGRVLNACSGVCQLDHDDTIIRNDIQKTVTLDKARTINGTEYDAGATVSTNADLQVPVEDLLGELPKNSFDTIVYDPPFSENQAEKTYGLDSVDPDADIPVTKTLDRLLKPGGTILYFGFSSTLMPDTYGYSMEDLALWNLFGGQFDWISSELHKPRSTSANTSLEASSHADTRVSYSDDVLPNADADTFTGVTGTTGGNNGQEISLTYHRYDEGTTLTEKAYELVSEYLTGRTLLLSDTDITLSHHAPVVLNSLGKAPEADAYFAPQRLSDEFADELFNSIVVDPAPEAFQNHLHYYGSKNVEASILKYESHPLLNPGGQIIQLGHTATLMNAELPYLRNSITILSTSDAQRDYIITIDEKQHEDIPWGITSAEDYMDTTRGADGQSCPICDSELVSDGRCLQCGSDVGTEHLCKQCGVGSFHDFVWYVDCPECGAHPNNYCVDTETGEVRRTPHERRVARINEKHENCTNPNDTSSTLVREPPVDLIDNDDSGTAQSSLTGF